ncbi:tetratricopeptide repeat protein [Polynucleobacter paneuropaeus]|nr:tetratricopeptide repeat protein [Polynucleobacter paneuropaeus]
MNTQIATQFHKAIKAFHEGDLPQAECLLNHYLIENPNHFDASHLLAIVYANQGRQEEASTQYQNALKLNPLSISALSNWGSCLNGLGQHHEAINTLEKALALDKNMAALWFNAANILCDLGDFNKANVYYKKALELNPQDFLAHNNYGKSLFACGSFDQALNQYQKTLELRSDYAEAWSNQGNALNELGRYDEALACHEKSLGLEPDFPQAWSNKGNTLQALKCFSEALDCYNTAVGLDPNFVEAWSNKGNVLNELKSYREALACYNKALSFDPLYAEAWSNKGLNLQALKQYEEALDCYNKAISLKPDFVEAWSNKGNTLNELKKYKEALICYDKAIALNQFYVEAWLNKGALLGMLRQYEDAIYHYEKTLSINPSAEYIFGSLVDLKKKICFWKNAEEDIHMLNNGISSGEKVSNPFHFLGIKDDALVQRECAEIFAQANLPANQILGAISKRTGKHEKIKIAYFSADFRRHAVAQLVAEIFELHDRSQFEVYGFSLRDPENEDDLRLRIKDSFDYFYEVENKTDQEIAALARELEIDIAVDLGGYTQFARTEIFSFRAAPIQVNYLGYPGTMGAPYMDYVVADPILIPQQSQDFYIEKIAYLPDTYQPNDRKRQIASKQFTKSELGLPEQGFVFCCFNNNFKINPQVFDGWATILKQVPGSVLWLLEDNALAKANLEKEALQRGIAPERLVFAGRLETSEHLARHALADLFLDTFPYNAHTTASDALWAGLPILTLIGQSFAARVAASLLNAIDLPELVTQNQQEYEALAVELATHPEKLAQIKRKLQDNRLTKPLFDTPRYTKNIEAAYTQMYGRYQAGLPPDHLYI